MEIDFITALGRLLRDGQLRSAFATDPRGVAAQVRLCAADLPGWLALVPEELEVQARVLLQKRLALVRLLLPRTMQRLGQEGWPYFLECARNYWPAEKQAALEDARRFCLWLQQKNQNLVSRGEWNRLQFACAKKSIAFHWNSGEDTCGRRRVGVQILFRTSEKCLRELKLEFGV